MGTGIGMNVKYIGLADKISISASTLCAIHCITLPLLIGVFPAVGTSFFGDEAFHFWLLWLVIPLSAFALLLGCRRHKVMSVLGIGAAGVGFLIAAAVLGHELGAPSLERGLTLLGATVIAVAHYRNYRHCRSSNCDHH